MSAATAQHAWLIGASRGMGLEVGRQLAAAGWRVTLSARDPDRLAQAASELGAAALALDITDRDAVSAGAAQMFAADPPTLIMINAGDYEPMSLAAFDAALFERLNRVNYLGVVNVIGAVTAPMRDHGGGQILINASAAGYRGLPGAAPYSAPKAAAIHLAEALHPEAARWGIRLRVINPGFVRSRLTAKNRFRMPAMLEPEQAARRIVARLDSRSFEISFPRRLVWPLKLLRCLPYALYFRLIARKVLPT
jgi:short-subunit dehydrogenase